MSIPLNLHCNSTGTITIDTTAAYCVIPGSHPGMTKCCNELGNGSTVQYELDCYGWCNLTAAVKMTNPPLSTLWSMFSDCLDGVNSTYGTFGLGCSNNDRASGSTTGSPSSSTPKSGAEEMVMVRTNLLAVAVLLGSVVVVANLQ